MGTRTLMALMALTLGFLGNAVHAQSDREAQKEKLKETLRGALSRTEKDLGDEIERIVRSRSAPRPAARPAAQNQLQQDLGAALNNGGKLPERLKKRMGPGAADVEAQLVEFLAGNSLGGQIKQMLGDDPEMIAEVLEPMLLRDQLEGVLGGTFEHDPTLRAEFDAMLADENFGTTLRYLLGENVSDPLYQPLLKKYGAGGAAQAPASAPAGGGDAFIDELSHAINNGGRFRDSGQALIGAEKAARIEAMLGEFLGGEGIAGKIPWDDSDPEGSKQMVIEFLGEPELLKMQLEELLGPDVLEGEIGEQFNAALTPERYPFTLHKLLGGDRMDPRFLPVIEELKARAPKSGGAEHTIPGAPTPPVVDDSVNIAVPPAVMLKMLQETFRKGLLPESVRPFLGPRADLTQDALNRILKGQPLSQRLNEICAKEAKPKETITRHFGADGELSTTFKNLASGNAELSKTIDDLFGGDVPATLKKLLGGDPLPDQVAVLYGLLPTGGAGSIGARIDVQEAEAVITLVADASGAENGGLKVGDAVRAINGKQIRSRADLGAVLSGSRAGDLFVFTVDRDGEELTRYAVAHQK